MTAIERAVTRFAMNMVAAVGLALLLLALHAAMAPAVEAASPTSAFGWGSEIGDRIATGHSGYADSTDHTFTATESNGFTSVQIRDAGNSLVAVITATGPDGARLVAGTTYADTSYDSSPGVPRIDIFLWDLNGGCSGIVGSFTVHDVAYAGPVFERLSMSVALTCWGNSYGASFAGELRFDTSAPAFNAATIVEDPIYRNFIDRRIGQVSGTKTWTLRNPGPNTLAVGTATMTGPDPTEFEFLDDACSNTTLASGGTCTFGTRFAPTKRGEHQAFASMPVDTPLGHVQAWLRGDGYERTSTTVEAPAGWQFGRVDFTATVTPNPVRTGSYSPRIMFRFPDGGPGHTVSVDENGVATIWGTFAPGEYRVYAEFQYYEQYAPSRSSVKTFKVGETTHITLLTDDNPALPPERPTITARLHNTVTPYAGGELIIEDVTVGVVLGRLDVSAGQQRLEVQPELSIGPHVIRASYSGHDIHSPSTAELTQRMTLDATAAVAPAKFYPYVDGYLDELHVTGRRNVSTAVGVRIWHRDTEEVYFDHTTQPATGDYRISWLGVDPGTGELAPEGVYRIAVTLDGGGTAPTVVNDTAVVRHDWVEWKKKSVTLPGKKFWLYGWSRNGKVSTSASPYSGGVRLASGKGVAVVVYSFPVAKYKIYGWMSMDVLGRSPNRHKAVSALWNKSLGSARDLGNYDAVKAIGPGYRWWKLGTQGQGRVKDGKARGMVMTWKGLGRSGPAIFDIKKVRLTYKVGILHEPVGIATVDSGSEFEQELLARAPDGPVGERITDLAPLEELPELHLASELPVADGVSAPASTLYYQTGPDAPVWKGRTLYTTSDESVFSGWAVETPTEDMRFVISSDVVAGQTYTDGMVKVRDRGPVIGYCGTNESAFTVNDIARDADGTTTMLSLTARWTCLDYITEEPTGSFFAELRYNTAEPAHGGLVPEVAPDWWEPSVWQYDRLQLRSAAIGSRSDNTLLFTAIGTKPTTIGQATISGYRASNFAVVNDTCSNTTLLVGETCSVDLRLQPSARGYREAVVTIPLDTVIGEREFEVYGYGQHATTTTISLPKGPHTETFSVRTQLQPLPDDPTGGNRCMALRREGPYGHLTVEAWCDLDGVSSFTEESLKVGRWTFQATSAETKGFASSTSALAATRVVKEIRDWGTSFVDRKTFYPYPDGYRDTVAAHGNRKFPMAVAITVTSVASGEVVAEHTIPAAATKYRWEWDGMVGGALAPAGAYDIETTLTENKWTEQTFTRQVTLSRQWVQWRTKSVTLPGKAFALSGKSKDAYISKTRSRWSSGVRIGSGKGAAMVVYALPVAKAQAYGSMTFSVLGRSPNRHKAVGAVWNPKLGGYRNGGNYDAAVEFGPGYKWWKTTAGADGRVRNGKIRAAVMVWKGLGRTGPAVFDIRKVKLTYKVGSLQPVNTAPPLSLAWSLATDQDGLATGRMVRWMPGSGRLPLASDVAIPPDLTPYETLDEDGAMTDEAVEPDSLEEPTVSPAPEATEVPEEPEPSLTPEPTAEPKPTPEPTSEPTVAPKSTPEPTPTPTPSATPTPAPEVPAEPTPEPTVAPKPTPEPTPEPKPTPKPTPTPSATPTPAPEVPAEPTPELTPVNLAPSADAGGPYKVDEGDSVKLDGTASRDPDGKIVGYEWSRQKRLDDPTRKRPLFEAIDDAVLEIDLTVTDDRGASDTASARIKVRNVDPRITGLEPLRVLVGEEVELAFVIRDPGPDEHEFSIDWGDGTVGASRLHVYETGGDYQVVINVVDDDGGSGSAESTVTVSEVAEIAGSSPQMGSAATDE